MTITIGNDVEFILTNESGPISSIGLIGGSKKFPRPCKLGALQEDNVLAEINIYPAETVKEWEKNNTTVIKELNKLLPVGITLSPLASALYDGKELDNPSAQEFGCDPDMNAWEEKFNKFQKLAGKFRFLRSAGGHVHIGIPGMAVEDKFELIRCMDTFIGLQVLILDKDKRRKMLYGKAGAMRIKPYGVEWRVPSNFWIHSKENRKWMFEAAYFCALNFKDLQKVYTNINVAEIINTDNAKSAIKNLHELFKVVKFPINSKLEV